MFSILETFSDTLLWWFPLYYTFKVAFLLWCQAPLTRGAEFMYKNFLRGWFLAYQSRIDNYIASASFFGSSAITAANNAAASSVVSATMARGFAAHAQAEDGNGGLRQRAAGAEGAAGAGAPVDERSVFGAKLE